MRPGEVFSWVFWRGLPVVLVIWAVRSGAIDYKRYLAIITQEKNPAVEQLDFIAGLVIEHYKKDHILLGGYEFQTYLIQHPEARKKWQRPDVDPFGGTIAIERIDDGFVLRSSGPDRKTKTADDVVKQVNGLEKLAVQ